MTSRPARPRALLNFDHSANLEGCGSSGKFETLFHREIGSEQEKIFGRVIYASETIQNCKNPTSHIDTLSYSIARLLTDTTHNFTRDKCTFFLAVYSFLPSFAETKKFPKFPAYQSVGALSFASFNYKR